MLHDDFRSELDALLAASHADVAFRDDVLAFADGRAAARLALVRQAPRIKVLRLIAQLLHAEPGLALARVQVDATSGCADFRGTLAALAPERTHAWRFRWDCRWAAERSGWLTPWGTPDQGRAAEELNWRCFAVWEPTAEGTLAPSAVEQRA